MSRKIEFSSEDINRIKEYYINDHLSSRKICKLFNCSKTVIERILKENNVEMRDDSHKWRQYTLNENYFDVIDTPNKAYLIGLLWADGYNCVKKDEIKLALQARDRDILDKMNIELDSNRPLKLDNRSAKNSNHQDVYRLSIYNKHMSKQLESLGMI